MVIAEKSPDRLVLKKPAHPITVREILSHTSGLVGRSPLERELDMLSLARAVITYASSPLQFEPGSQYEYCNPGINTVGRMIEVVSGMRYEEFMQTAALRPARHERHDLLAERRTIEAAGEIVQARRRRQGARGDQDHPAHLSAVRPETASLSGRRFVFDRRGRRRLLPDDPERRQFTTASGYFRKQSVREMTSTQTGNLLNHGKGEHGYGLGWSTSRKSPGESGPVIPGPCGHGGAYATDMSIDPANELITVFMVQHAGYPGVDGGKILGDFKRRAVETFGSKARGQKVSEDAKVSGTEEKGDPARARIY